jgi:putative Mn2+ efflux pump MntP
MMEAVLLALALAMDATAVAAGRAVTGLGWRAALVLAGSFGLFQAGMAAIGWALGQSAKTFIEGWDHWVAFGLLGMIGGKMLIEALIEAFRDDDHSKRSESELDLLTVLVLSIATSIDSLAAGVTLPVLRVPAACALALIGAASFVLSLVGAGAGAVLGARLGKRLEVLGGVTLIAIGTKTLIEHVGGHAG